MTSSRRGLEKAEKAMVLLLVRDCMADLTLCGILADVFDEAYPLLAEDLRCRPCYRLLIASLELGNWKAVAVAKKCRGIIRGVGSALCATRQVNASGVGVTCRTDGYANVSRAEQDAFVRGFASSVLIEPFTEVLAQAISLYHCRHLAWLALDIGPYALELQSSIPKFQERIRNAVNERCI